MIEKQIERDAILMLQQQKRETVEGFFNYYEFLKSEFPSKVYYAGEFYNSVAHAYMAAKTDDPVMRRRILKAPTFKEM